MYQMDVIDNRIFGVTEGRARLAEPNTACPNTICPKIALLPPPDPPDDDPEEPSVVGKVALPKTVTRPSRGC